MDETETPGLHIRKCFYCDVEKKHCDSEETCEEPDSYVCGDENNVTECYYKFMLDVYKNKLKECNNDLVEAKNLNNQFRTIMLGPSAMEAMVKNGTFDVATISLYIAKSKLSWSKMSIETGIVFLNLHQEFGKAYAEWIYEKSSKINIKKELINRRVKEHKASQRQIESEKESEEDKRYYRTAEGKAVKANMKNFGITKEKAQQMLKEMGGI